MTTWQEKLSPAWPPLIGCVVVMCLFLLPQAGLLEDLIERYVASPFSPSHIWVFDHIARMVLGDEPFSNRVTTIGFPDPRDARLILWFPSLLAIPLRSLVGPVGAFNIVILLTPVASFLATYAFIRRLTDASRWVAAGGAIPYVLGPFALGCFAAGQLAKIQLWIAPLFLMGLHGVMKGPRRFAWLALLGAVIAAAAPTSPSLVMFLPFAAVVLVLVEVAKSWRAPIKPILGAVAAAAISAAALMPAFTYYGASPASDVMPAFVPATPPPLDPALRPAPTARFQSTFLGTGLWHAPVTEWRGPRGELISSSGDRIEHVTYLILPLLLAAALLSSRGFRGRGFAWGLVAVGLVLALGPYLIINDAFVLRGGRRVILPVWLLEHFDYPTARSGMYYRAIHLAALGVSLGLAGGLSAWPGRLRGMLLAVLLPLALADTYRATESLWPLEVKEIEGHRSLVAIDEDPVPGAVLEMPIEISMAQSQPLMLAAVFHGRPTTALPQDRFPWDDPSVGRLSAEVEAALAKPTPAARQKALGNLGFSHVILREALAKGTKSAQLPQLLGQPTVDGNLSYWRLNAAPSP